MRACLSSNNKYSLINWGIKEARVNIFIYSVRGIQLSFICTYKVMCALCKYTEAKLNHASNIHMLFRFTEANTVKKQKYRINAKSQINKLFVAWSAKDYSKWKHTEYEWYVSWERKPFAIAKWLCVLVQKTPRHCFGSHTLNPIFVMEFASHVSTPLI